MRIPAIHPLRRFERTDFRFSANADQFEKIFTAGEIFQRRGEWPLMKLVISSISAQERSVDNSKHSRHSTTVALNC
jgi:hypothetical protein